MLMHSVKNKQAGAALVVALIILLVVTLLGVTGIQNSSNELKLSLAAQSRAQSFEAAEAVLKKVEADTIASPPSVNNFVCTDSDKSSPRCTLKDCVNSLCFKGNFSGASRLDCDVINPAATQLDYWMDSNIWSGSGLIHENYTYATTGQAKQIKYIIEFLCMGKKSLTEETALMSNEDTITSNLATLLRITVKADGPQERTPVYLQSVIKVKIK